MNPAAIKAEMRPKGFLREAIRELADVSGAYVIVSGSASVTDTALAARRKAMRDALTDCPKAGQLHTDFYDRDRLAIWVNQYPGITIWVLSTIGRPLSGWSAIGEWEGINKGDSKPYLLDENACLIDESARDKKRLLITEGIRRLRDALRTPRQCLRLIGLSGVGKTRLVQALFEQNVGSDSLDPSLTVYTDYSSETIPTARDMARGLIARKQRAILIVDNCNPNSHSELAQLCASDGSEVSLMTVEYDVRDDEPERTDVFRLELASPKLVGEWIEQNFSHLSQIDRERIAEFSDGNFRVAGALAQTVRKGETLGSLKNRDLLERIFRQRNEADPQLLRAAEDLSLLYSIDGEDVSNESELALVGSISNTNARHLYEALVTMNRRGLVQARGHFRAVLPQAIANTLAAHALERIPPTEFDKFCSRIPPRMLKSVSRRLGYLHDSNAAQATVTRWLQFNGPLGDLCKIGEGDLQVLTNIAPVAPEAVLRRLEKQWSEVPHNAAERHKWISLIKALGYDGHLFERAATLLAPYAGTEAENNNINSARNTFSSFFHFYLSGTQATPGNRHSLIRKLAASDEESLRHSADIALRALFESHFISSSSHDFGARSRDWGWHPKNNKDVWDWYENAIALVIELTPDAGARVILANNVRELWRYPGCRDALDRAATAFLRQRPWVEGWIACRACLRFDGKHMSEEVRGQLEQIINRLKPSDLLNQARAVVLNRMPGGGGWDFADGEGDEENASDSWKKADKMAQEVGRWLANDAETRGQFFPELFTEPQAMRAFECGRGLAEGADDLDALWTEVSNAYAAANPEARNATALGGFLHEAHNRSVIFVSSALEELMDNRHLSPLLPYLQARAGLYAEGIDRLRRAISRGILPAFNFNQIANGSVSDSPPELLAGLLEDISALSGGVEVALNILQMYFFGEDKEGRKQHPHLIAVGRDLLVRFNFRHDGGVRDSGVHTVMLACLRGDDAKDAAEKICANIGAAIDAYHIGSHNMNYIFEALAKTQPMVALDSFVVATPKHRIRLLFDRHSPIGPSLKILDPATLHEWASKDPDTRYPLLGMCISMFRRSNNEEQNEISSFFMSVLKSAPDKRRFLGDFWERVHPDGWTGSLAHILGERKAQLLKLSEDNDPEVRSWVSEAIPYLDRCIEDAHGRDRAIEESFE